MFFLQNTRKPVKHRHEKKRKKKQHKKVFDNMKWIKKNLTSNNNKSTKNIELITFAEYEDNDTFVNQHEHWDYGKNQSYSDDEVTSRNLQRKSTWVSLMNLTPPPLSIDHISDGFFCDAPSKNNILFFIKSLFL